MEVPVFAAADYAAIDNSARLDEAYSQSHVLSPRCFDSVSAWLMTMTDRRRFLYTAYVDVVEVYAVRRMARL